VKYLGTVLLLLLPLTALAASPNDVISEASQLLAQQLEARKAELSNDRQALYAVVDDILLPRFDRKLAAQLVLGQHWRNASDVDRKRFIDAFYVTLLHRYADGVFDFDLSRLEILPYRGDATKNRTSVKTRIQLEDGTVVPVTYSLIKRADGWRMYDVVIEGISYVRNFRAELDSEIRSADLGTVIDRLEAEAAAPIMAAPPQ